MPEKKLTTKLSAAGYARKVAIAVMGISVLIVGVVMLITPGPAFIVIPAGLAILGLEFAWARRLNRRIKEQAKRAMSGISTPQDSSAK